MIEDLQKKLNGKRILITCQKYFGYEERIVKRLIELGADVFYIDQRPDNTLITKVVIRLIPFLYRAKIYFYYRKKIKGLGKFDIILVIRVEGLSPSVLKCIKKTASASECILYMWDSFSNNKRAQRMLSSFDKILTFDPVDAQRMNIHFRPLFFCSQRRVSEVLQKNIDISFIGTGHSDRAKIINEIRKQYENLNKNYFFYIFLQTPILFYLRKIINDDFRKFHKSMFRFSPLKYDEYEKISEESKAVIDVEHPDQTGLTMRTFEMLGKETKLITTNKNIKKYDFYNDSNILIIDRLNPVLNEEFLEKDYQPLSRELYYKYSIDGWLEDVFL
jgi:hypothetical protein